MLASAGCGEADITPPTLLEASFVAAPAGERPDTLVLQFSEPIGPIANVDPDHFRMSTAMVIDDGQGGELTVYYDLAHHFTEGLPGQAGRQPDLDGPWPRHAFTDVVAIERGAADDQLILQLSYPLELAICDALDQAETLGIPAGIFVHYAQAERPRIVDEAGNPLADVASHWMAVNGVTTAAGVFPSLDPTLAIPCP